MCNAFRNECLHLCIVVEFHSQLKLINMNTTELLYSMTLLTLLFVA